MNCSSTVVSNTQCQCKAGTTGAYHDEHGNEYELEATKDILKLAKDLRVVDQHLDLFRMCW